MPSSAVAPVAPIGAGSFDDDELPDAAFELSGPTHAPATIATPPTAPLPSGSGLDVAPPASTPRPVAPSPPASSPSAITGAPPSAPRALDEPLAPAPQKKSFEMPPAVLDAVDRVVDFFPRAWWLRGLLFFAVAVVLGNGCVRGYTSNSTIILFVIMLVCGGGLWAGLKYAK